MEMYSERMERRILEGELVHLQIFPHSSLFSRPINLYDAGTVFSLCLGLRWQINVSSVLAVFLAEVLFEVISAHPCVHRYLLCSEKYLLTLTRRQLVLLAR